MTGQIIVGLSGHIGSGKTTVAKRLVETHGFVRTGFADGLKDEVARTLRRTLKAYLRAIRPDVRTRDDLGGVEEGQWAQYIRMILWETRDEFSRSLLQEWGTELRRAENPDYWVAQWERRAIRLQKVVVDDCRFVNEAEAIRKLGGFLIRVRRPYSGLVVAHVSEHALAEWTDWDFTLDNDGDLDDLAADTDRIAKAILSGGHMIQESGQS